MGDTPGAPGVVIKDVWELKEQIGKGSFAVVWKAQNRADGRLVAAVKEIATEKLNSKLTESLESEVAVLMRAKHPNIVALLEVQQVRPRPDPSFLCVTAAACCLVLHSSSTAGEHLAGARRK